MSTYISLMKFTDEGMRNIKEAPQRVANAKKMLEAMGCKLIGMYSVMGEYDYVAIAEGPNDEVAMTYLLALGAAGQVRTTTLKAFSMEEFAAAIEKLQ